MVVVAGGEDEEEGTSLLVVGLWGESAAGDCGREQGRAGLKREVWSYMLRVLASRRGCRGRWSARWR
jgi:hypothetical protein